MTNVTIVSISPQNTFQTIMVRSTHEDASRNCTWVVDHAGHQRVWRDKYGTIGMMIGINRCDYEIDAYE